MGRPDIAAELMEEEPGFFAVWPDNMLAVDAFLIVSTQWRAVSMPTGQVLWLGLDYASAKVVLDGEEMALTPAGWSGLRIMERAAAAVLNGRG